MAVAATKLELLNFSKTTLNDVTFHHDMFVPYPKEGSKGVRVTLK